MACKADTRQFFCRMFALVSAVAMQKMKAKRLRHRAFVSSKQATRGRAKGYIENHCLIYM